MNTRLLKFKVLGMLVLASAWTLGCDSEESGGEEEAEGSAEESASLDDLANAAVGAMVNEIEEGVDQANAAIGEAAEATGEVVDEINAGIAEATGTAEADEAEEEPSFEEMVAASEPLAPTPAPQTVGARTITAEVCTINGYEFLDDSTMDVIGNLEIVGNHLYVVNLDSNLVRFNVTTAGEGCTFDLDTGFGENGVLDLERDIETISFNGERIVASNGVFQSYVMDATGAMKYECDARSHGYVALAGNGAWGIGRFVSADVKRVEFTDTGCTAAEWTYQSPFSQVHMAGFLGDMVVLGGTLEEQVNGRNPKQVIAFNADGTEVWRQGNTEESFADDGYGWMHAIEECAGNLCVVDSNFRALHIIDNAGTHQGKVSLSDLFDLRYPWISDLDVAADGNIYLVAGQERGDSDVAQGLIYRISGI